MDKFKLECISHLNKNFGRSGLDFMVNKSSGKGNILAKVKTRHFYLEAKQESQEVAQFVVSYSDAKEAYVYGDANHMLPSPNSMRVLDVLNSSNKKVKPGSRWELDVSPTVAFNRITEHYKAKGIRYIITKHSGRFVIVPLDKLEKYFNVRTVVRSKRSGSADMSDPVWDTISSHDVFDEVETVIKENSELHLIFNKDKLPDELEGKEIGSKTVLNLLVSGYNHRIQLEKIDDKGRFYIRRLSNTQNPTVSFIMTPARIQDPHDLKEIEYDFKYI